MFRVGTYAALIFSICCTLQSVAAEPQSVASVMPITASHGGVTLPSVQNNAAPGGPIYGIIEVNISAIVVSTFAKGTVFGCSTEITFNEGGPPTYLPVFEEASAPATVSGTKLTCTVKTPILWNKPLPNATPGGFYYIYAYNPTSGIGPLGQGPFVRTTQQPITSKIGTSIPLPTVYGGTTTVTENTAF